MRCGEAGGSLPGSCQEVGRSLGFGILIILSREGSSGIDREATVTQISRGGDVWYLVPQTGGRGPVLVLFHHGPRVAQLMLMSCELFMFTRRTARPTCESQPSS